MHARTGADEISGAGNPSESKGDSHAHAATLEHIEDEPEPQIHLKTILIIAVSLFRPISRASDH